MCPVNVPEGENLHEVKVDVERLMKRVTLNVKLIHVRRFVFRVKIATALIRLAATVMGVGVYFDDTPAEKVNESCAL